MTVFFSNAQEEFKHLSPMDLGRYAPNYLCALENPFPSSDPPPASTIQENSSVIRGFLEMPTSDLSPDSFLLMLFEITQIPATLGHAEFFLTFVACAPNKPIPAEGDQTILRLK